MQFNQQMAGYGLLIASLLYAVIIVIILFLATRKVRKLRAKLLENCGEEGVAVIAHLLHKMQGELTPGDMELLIKKANQLPVILSLGEFSYISGLQKIIFTKIPF